MTTKELTIMKLNHLTERQAHIALISILTTVTKTDVERLKQVLADALDFGITINEINEEIIHLYCYVGFAPACRANIVFMELVEERRNRGIHDDQGREPSPLDETESKYARGEKLQILLTGMTAEQLQSGIYKFNPLLDYCLKEHLFADLFARDLLSPIDREITTVSALASMEDPLVVPHYGGALNVGVTEEQLRELLTLIKQEISVEIAETGCERLEHTLETRNQKQ